MAGIKEIGALRQAQPLDKTQDEKTLSVKEKRKPSLRYQRDRDREKVRGIFKYYEVPGGSVSFSFKEYREDDVERYDLIDGRIYNIPLGVAKHLNKRGWYPIHKYIKTEEGGTAMKIGEKVRRFGFQSLEFVDVEELTPEQDIVTVEKEVIK